MTVDHPRNASIAGPPGMPPQTKEWIATAFSRAMAKPEVVDKLRKIGVEPASTTRVDDWVSGQLKVWAQAAKDAKLTP